MERYQFVGAQRTSDVAVHDLMASVAAGEDPRLTIARLNLCIVACQRDGLDVPPSFLRLTRTLAAQCLLRVKGRGGWRSPKAQN